MAQTNFSYGIREHEQRPIRMPVVMKKGKGQANG